MSKVRTTKDLILLLLFARGSLRDFEPIRGRTRLMKMIFLFDKEIKKEFNLGKVITNDALPDFKPYDFGPFSAKVFSDLEFLVNTKFVKVKRIIDSEMEEEEKYEYEYWQTGINSEEEGNIYNQEEFYISDIGKEFVQDGEAGKLTPDQWKTLNEFKKRCVSISLRTLLKYVYMKYPDMATKSIIRTKLMENYGS